MVLRERWKLNAVEIFIKISLTVSESHQTAGWRFASNAPTLDKTAENELG
jgi:hypothetical protein